MASLIKCSCGNSIHKNLFSGAHVSIVVEDEILDRIDDTINAGDAISEIIVKGDVLVKCSQCGNIAIEDQVGEVTFYRKV